MSKQRQACPDEQDKLGMMSTAHDAAMAICEVMSIPQPYPHETIHS